MTIAAPNEKALTGRQVLYMLIAFFGVMLAVNGVFLYFAVTTFTGLDTPDAYRKGLAYNATLQEAEAQAALGWTSTLAVDETSRVVQVKLTGKDATPVTGLTLQGSITRPVTDAFDRDIGQFVERQAGVYEITLAGLDKGVWVVAVDAREPEASGGRTLYRMKERIWLKQ